MRQDQEGAPPGASERQDDAGFVRRFWQMALLIGGPAVLSLGGAGINFLYVLWFAAAALAIGAIFVALGLALTGSRREAAGMVAGVAISTLVLTVTCFANLQSWDLYE